jgi:hypothetical protein
VVPIADEPFHERGAKPSRTSRGALDGVRGVEDLRKAVTAGEAAAARLGLASALADTFVIEPAAVQVVTSVVSSGSVVEAGRTLHW